MKIARRAAWPQQVTRIPRPRPGDWVRLQDGAARQEGLAVGQVKSLAAVVTDRSQCARWRVFLQDGRQVSASAVIGVVTEAEALQLRWRR